MKVHHLFIPHEQNNHRAKLLHNVSLFTLIIAVAFVSTFTVFIHKTHPEVLGISYQISNQELLNLTNYERSQNKLAPVSLNSELTTAAQNKAANMFKYDYWAHFAPDGTSPWDFIRGAGYNYSYAGENLARGFTTSIDAVNAWMKSPTHRANILASQYKDVGFAIAEGKLQGEDTVLIVQEFGAREDQATTNNLEKTPVAAVNEAQIPGSEVQGSFQSQLPLESSLSKPSINSSPFFNLTFATKALTFILLSLLLIALILDFVIIEKKKIPRSVGNNLDHIMLITIFITFLFMAKLGNII